MKILRAIRAAWRELRSETPQKKTSNPTGVLARLRSLLSIKGRQPENEGVDPKVLEEIQRLPVLPLSEQFLMAFMEQHKGAVYSLTIKKMSSAVKANAKEILLFRVGEHNNVLRIRKDNFEGALKDMMAYFTTSENYEAAQQCKVLMNKHYVNRLLDST